MSSPSNLLAVAGTDGRVVLNGQNMNARRFSAQSNAADLETTNFESVDGSGVTWEEGITGKRSYDIEWEMDFDLGADFPLTVGAYSPLTLYISKTSSVGIQFSAVRNLTATYGTSIEGKANVVFKCKSHGPVSLLV